MVREIQGLRAIAILWVLLYHFGIPAFERGYLGVDLFFTISGFVIAMSWWERITDFRSLGKFYLARFWRLFPSSLAVIAATLSLAQLVLLPQDISITREDGLFAALQIINIRYLLTTNYFSDASAYKLFIHFWSLAVEEQFYVGCGLLALALSAIGRRWSMPSLWLILVLSLAISLWAESNYGPADFFSPVTRAWQFATGIIAARLVRDAPPRPALVSWKAPGLFVASIVALIPFAVPLLDEKLTQVVLAASAAATCYLAAGGSRIPVLGNKAFVWLGGLSYSLYLVHWPVIAFLIYFFPQMDLPAKIVVAGIVTFALAQLLHRVVEMKFRYPFERRSWMAGAAGLLGLLAIIVTSAVGGLRPIPPEANSLRAQAGVRAEIPSLCDIYDKSIHSHGRLCVLNADGTEPQVAFIGDSHLGPLSPELANWAHRTDRSFVLHFGTGCLPLPNIPYSLPATSALCGGLVEAAISDIAARPSVTTVVMVARWSAYDDVTSDKEGYIEAGLRAAVALLRDDQDLVVLGQVPEFDVNIPMLLAYLEVGASGQPELEDWLVNYSLIRNRIEIFAADNPRISYVDLAQDLCDLSQPRTCYISAENGQYADNNHLTPDAGSRLLQQSNLLEAVAP